MTFNHLVLIGGGHTNVLLLKKWLMFPKLMPEIPVSIISRDSHLVYSAIFPSVLSKSITLEESLIDIKSLATNAKVSFIEEEVKDIDFNLREIILSNRPSVNYSKLVLNYGSQTIIPKEFESQVKNRNAFSIKPFLRAYDSIQKEDIFDSVNELPFVIVGSGLAAIEVSYALRKRWRDRPLKLLCDSRKINITILKSLRNSNIDLVENLNFEYGKILLCTGNTSPSWAQKKLLDSDSHGRIITKQNLQLKSFSGIFAAGDCAVVDSEDLEKACQRFLVNNSEIKILEDYINIKKLLNKNQKNFNHFSPSSWTEFIEERNLNDETVKLLICDGVPYWRKLFKWLFIYKFIKSKKDGETLKKEGWHPGKEMGKEIKRLRYLEIDKLNKN